MSWNWLLQGEKQSGTLERVPMDKRDFKPHEKSMTLGWLATCIAILRSETRAVVAPLESLDEERLVDLLQSASE